MEVSGAPVRWLEGPAARRLAVGSVVALLMTLAVQVGMLVDSGRKEASRRDAVVVAERVAVALTSYRSTDGSGHVRDVQHDLTGTLRKQFASDRALLESILKDSGATSVSSAELSGVEKAGEKSFRVLVAVTAQVKNREAPKGETRRYRMRLTLANIDGAWRAREMELVP